MSGTIGGHTTLSRDAIEALREAVEIAASTTFGEGAVALPPDSAVLTGMEGSTSIIPENPNSVGLVIAVPDPTDKNSFLSFGQAAVLNAGIPLIAGVKPLVLLAPLSDTELFAISAPSGCTIVWQQFESAP